MMRRMAVGGVAAAMILVVLAGCGGAGPASPNPTPEGSPAVTPVAAFDGLVIDVVAKGQAYSMTELEVPAGAPFRILLDNQDKDARQLKADALRQAQARQYRRCGRCAPGGRAHRRPHPHAVAACAYRAAR